MRLKPCKLAYNPLEMQTIMTACPCRGQRWRRIVYITKHQHANAIMIAEVNTGFHWWEWLPYLLTYVQLLLSDLSTVLSFWQPFYTSSAFNLSIEGNYGVYVAVLKFIICPTDLRFIPMNYIIPKIKEVFLSTITFRANTFILTTQTLL